jgi:hypothetical protein
MFNRFALLVLLSTVFLSGSLSAQGGAGAPKHFDVFRATIGVDDGVLARGTSAIFKVYLDDKEVSDSGVVRPGEDPRGVEIALGDAKKLLLEVADTGDGHGGDWGNWCDARLENSQTGDLIFLSDMKEKVVSEWIDTKKDRNIINEPLKLLGRIYCKGLGTISGSKMEYSGWNELAAALDAEHSKYDTVPVRLKGEIPDGVVVRVGEKEYSSHDSPIDVDVQPRDKMTVSLPTTEGESFLSEAALPNLEVRWGEECAGLGQLIPSRLIHYAPDDGQAPILLGRPYWGGSGTGDRVDVVYDRWRITSREPFSSEVTFTGYDLECTLGIQASKQAPFGTCVFRVLSGDSVSLDDTLVTGSGPYNQVSLVVDPRLPLTLEVDDMGDGNYGDDALWADICLVRERPIEERTDEQQRGEVYLLSDFDPWSAKVGWERLGVNTNSVGGQMQIGDQKFFSGFGASAKSKIVFKDLLPTIEAMRSAAEKVAEAKAVVGDTEAARRLLDEAKALDDKNPDIYLTLADLSVKGGDVQGELSALKRLVEISRARVPQRRKAKERIDEIYSEIGLAKPPKLGGMKPLEATDRLDISDLGGTIRTVTIGGEVPDDDPLLLLPGFVRFRVGKERTHLRAVVDSRGTELALEILQGWPERSEELGWALLIESTEPKICPAIEATLNPGEYTLLIWHDGNKDKIERDFSVPVAFEVGEGAIAPAKEAIAPSKEAIAPPQEAIAPPQEAIAPSKEATAPANEAAAVPKEEWTYTIGLDGSVKAEGKITGADVIQIPLTAEKISVVGAEHTLMYPVFEYCSKIGNRESVIMTVVPGPSGECTVTYDWPDGAYNVPMSRYEDDHRKRFYFRTPTCLNEEVGKVPIAVTLPEGTGKLERLVPETFELSAPRLEKLEEQIQAEEGKKDYELKHPAIVESSFSVSIDGKALKRPDEYTVDAPSGTLKLTDAPAKGTTIAVSYSYVPADVPRTYSFNMDWDKPVTIHAANEKLQTAWLVETYKQMRVYIPETDYYRVWFPEYMALLQRIYDQESKAVGGYEPNDEILVSLTGPAQLSGYGGATWGGPLSESWIASTGRVGEYNLRCEPGGDGVEAHELKWVFLNGIGGANAAPHWLRIGAVIWIEEESKVAGGTAFPDIWCYQTLRKNARKYLDEYAKRPKCILQLPEDDYSKLNHSDRDVGDAMCWYIHDFFAHKYGEDFWGKFYKFQRDNPARYKILDPRSKEIQVVEDIVKISGDESARRQFIDWGFDLSPDPAYAPNVCVLFPAYWRFSPGDDTSWSNPGFDDSGWGKIAIGSVWEDNDEYKGLDGYAWYRLHFTIPASFEPSETMELSLGKIDDADEVFLNGNKVGQTGKFPPEYESKAEEQRRYDVPKDLVKIGGDNVLAVRVYDGGGDGGITGEGFWLRVK